MCVPWGNEEERAEWYKRRCEDLERELAAYEDTGLEPEDIIAAIASAEKLIVTMRNNKKAALWLRKYSRTEAEAALEAQKEGSRP